MSEECAHDWVRGANTDGDDERVFCRKCDADRIECWCGAAGTYDELFLSDGLGDSCHGTGVLDCHCGGDLCVCHHHGETDCVGCHDCEGDEWDEWDDYEEDGPLDLEDQLENALNRAEHKS